MAVPNSKLFICLILWSIFSLVSTTTDCNAGPCFPAPVEISSQFIVNASSTCGEDGEELYCNPDPAGNGECNLKCNARDPNLRHPASYVNDDYQLSTFWKSKNVVRPVYLQIDFNSIFMLYRSIVTFYFRLPAAMYFATSVDHGKSFKALGYYSTDCKKFFNMSTTETNVRDGLAVQCFQIDPQKMTQYQIEYAPMRDNKLKEYLADQQKQSFFLMTNIRLELVSYIIPTDSNFNISTASEILKRGWSFKIRDWDVLAACYCNGQASKCQNNTHCVCERNTAGRNCEKCLPLFNNRPYEIRQACQDCGCNNHAKSCHYNATKKYGICDDCSHNTTGDKCELCKVEYYRNSAVMKNHSSTCLPCGCNLNGVPVVWNRTHCHPTTGQCQCKSRVHGRACDTCKPTFWNLKGSNSLGCEECSCSNIGTVNASQLCDAANNGQCPCKADVDGRTCNKCKDGYYNLTVNNPQGCLACGCNAAGSLSVSCNSTGGCSCRPKFYGLKCEHLESGNYVPSVESMTSDAEYAVIFPDQEMKLNHTMLDFNGEKKLLVAVILGESNNVSSATQLMLKLTIPKTAFYTVVLRYMTSSDWFFLKITLQLSSLFSPFSCDGGVTNTTRNEPRVFRENATAAKEAVDFASNVCLQKGSYTAVLELQPGSSGGVENATIEVDSLVILPTVTSYSLFKFLSADVQQNITFYYRQASSFKHWSLQSRYGCQALSGLYGYLNDEGQACLCNATGSNNPDVCDQCGGQCACKPNVIGRTCDRCRPDYYNFTSGYGCQDCSCHAMGSTRSSCHATTGHCDCKVNVINRQCSACKPNYYNLNSGNGCLPCNCQADYSTSLQCHADSGVCSCKHGVGGTKCTECRDTFYNITTAGCVNCNCNTDGSHNSTCRKTTGQCPCKEHSIGRTCDTCPDGYYGLGSPHPKGCLQCQCSNKTSNCSTAEGWKVTELTSKLPTTVDSRGMDGWLVRDNNGQIITDTRWEWDVKLAKSLDPKLEMGFIRTTVTKEQYFSAPAKYLKEGRFAYTYTMSFKLQQDNHTAPEHSNKGDVILKGKRLSQPIVYRLPSPPVSSRFTGYTIKFIESDWYVNTTQGRRPTSTEMVAVLSTLEYIYIRAKWSTQNNINTRIADINMKFSNKSNQGRAANNVETCNCPKECEGQFCERCAPGYTRATPNGGAYVVCVPCSCNNHSNTCDPESGVCSGCQHNTTGNHCELCSDGLYGNATHGTANDCQPCPCPGGPFSTNQFSLTCLLDSDGQPTCNNCTEGHEGRRCEKCKNGYYGTPTEPNGKCRRCNCNGNVDTSVTGNCNTTTGECSNCGFNTTGFNCEKCASHFYGNALNRTCSSCQCNQLGSQNRVPCNHSTGQCACLPRVTGKSCDRCEANAFNFSSGVGCTYCNCHANGANKPQCNETTGICECKTNVKGDKCDTCVAGFYGVQLSPPCQECNCSSNFTANNTVCDVITGQCQCKVSRGGAKYGGRQCDRCSDRSVGKPDNCRPCSDGGKCFDKWYDLIKVESDKVKSLEQNVTDMLRAFGGNSVTVDSINKTIQELNKNLSEADNVFKGAQYNTKDKQEQINRIKASINDLHRRLNESSRIINEAQMYIQSTVNGFNGTVKVVKADQSGPVIDTYGDIVYHDWVSLRAMALSYRSRIVRLNESGHELFRNITSNYEAIKLANETAALAAHQISGAMVRLNLVSSQRADVENRLDSKFQAELQNNSATLDVIKNCSEEINELIRLARALGNNATTTITEAEAVINTANTTAHQRKDEAQKALVAAQNSLRNANKSRENATFARNLAAKFKTNASDVLTDSQRAQKNVTDGINAIAKAINQSRESKVIADTVSAMNLDVSLNDIKDLTNKIKAINVNETLINKTYEGAADGLQKAKDVEALSKKAVDVAQQTLNRVQSIEKAIETSESLRNETTDLQRQTDDKVNQINNITRSIQERFGNASIIGKETLQLINKTISTVDESLQCFNESKKTAEEAVVRAEEAYNITLVAEKLNETVSANITRLSEKIDPLIAIAQANNTSIVKAYNDSVQLYNDVNQAEVLLDEYINQRQEMEALKNETISLEKELDNLIQDFEEEEKKYRKCGNK